MNNRSSHTSSILLFGCLAFVLGAFSGACVWLVIDIMRVVIELLWTRLPWIVPGGSTIWYRMLVCAAGGALIGLWHGKHGDLPDSMEQVLGKVKRDGYYPYDHLGVVAVSALLPLFFGGAVGPEAGLSGIIAGLVSWVNATMRRKGFEVKGMEEAGLGAVMCALFGAPLFIFADEIESVFGIGAAGKTDRIGAGSTDPVAVTETDVRGKGKRLASRKTRFFLYAMSLFGALLVMKVFNELTGESGGLPRFSADPGLHLGGWKWFIPLVLIGAVGGLAFSVFDRVSSWMAERIGDRRVISGIAAGIILTCVSWLVPMTMFSGEDQLEELMKGWTAMGPAILLAMGISKLFLTNVCMSLGWRGGKIFPIIFGGSAIGFAAAGITGASPLFAVAVVVAALYGSVSKKPLVVVAVLMLCFPVAYIVPVAAGAYAGALLTGGKKIFSKKD